MKPCKRRASRAEQSKVLQSKPTARFHVARVHTEVARAQVSPTEDDEGMRF